jgi:hypothetical protein
MFFLKTVLKDCRNTSAISKGIKENPGNLQLGAHMRLEWEHIRGGSTTGSQIGGQK